MIPRWASVLFEHRVQRFRDTGEFLNEASVYVCRSEERSHLRCVTRERVFKRLRILRSNSEFARGNNVAEVIDLRLVELALLQLEGHLCLSQQGEYLIDVSDLLFRVFRKDNYIIEIYEARLPS